MRTRRKMIINNRHKTMPIAMSQLAGRSENIEKWLKAKTAEYRFNSTAKP